MKYAPLRPATTDTKGSPGPGQYNVKENNKYRNSSSFTLQGRYKAKKPETAPDPLSYSPNFKPVTKSIEGGTFGGEATKTKLNNSYNTPGPGEYNVKLNLKKGPSVIVAGKIEQSYETISPGPGKYELREKFS